MKHTKKKRKPAKKAKRKPAKKAKKKTSEFPFRFRSKRDLLRYESHLRDKLGEAKYKFPFAFDDEFYLERKDPDLVFWVYGYTEALEELLYNGVHKEKQRGLRKHGLCNAPERSGHPEDYEEKEDGSY